MQKQAYKRGSVRLRLRCRTDGVLIINLGYALLRNSVALYPPTQTSNLLINDPMSHMPTKPKAVCGGESRGNCVINVAERHLSAQFADGVGLLELAARSVLVSLAFDKATRLCSSDQTLLPDGR